MMRNKTTHTKNNYLIRVRFLHAILVCISVLILAKIVWIQFGPDAEALKTRAITISYDRVEIEANRGNILSHDGRVLAISIPTFEIRMDFAAEGIDDEVFNSQVDSLALALSSFFKDKSKTSYANFLRNARANKSKNRYTLISPRRVNYLELGEISKFPILRLGANRGGFITNQVNIRNLPHGSLARRTIGQVNLGGSKWGIEGAFDEYLKGVSGNTLMQKVSGSFRVPVPDEGNVEPQDGLDVVTTLDVDIQDVAEQALKNQLEMGNAQWGSVVLMEVETGEIRAMSNLTRHGEGRYSEELNYAIGMSLEPGSTFKLVSLMALLEQGGMSLSDSVDTEGGKAMVGRKLVVDDHKEGVLSLKEVFEVSSNIGFAKSINKVYADNPTKFVDFVTKIGLSEKLGVQIAGEQKPEVKRPGEKWWDGLTLTMMSYGYALRLTPMHTLALYNAVANDGRMMRPLLVKELRQYGQTVKTYEPTVINKSICSSSTLRDVQECLEGVVNEGTARLALKNPYYSVAGKTGTAQIPFDNGGYMDKYGGRNYLATLVGYFPADDPKYSCIVSIKTYYGPGSRRTFYGASLSGPVFRAIADQVYASNVSWQENVEKSVKTAQREAEQARKQQEAETGEKIEVVEKADKAPLVKGGDGKQMYNASSKLSIPVKMDKNIDQWAVSHLDSLGRTNMVEALETDDMKVPSVVGLGLKEAIYLLESRGLKVSFSGKGKVVSQSLRKGTSFNKGAVIVIRLN